MLVLAEEAAAGLVTGEKQRCRVGRPSDKGTNACGEHKRSQGAPNLWKLCFFYWLTDSCLQSDRTPSLWDMLSSRMLTSWGESQVLGGHKATVSRSPSSLLTSLVLLKPRYYSCISTENPGWKRQGPCFQRLPFGKRYDPWSEIVKLRPRERALSKAPKDKELHLLQHLLRSWQGHPQQEEWGSGRRLHGCSVWQPWSCLSAPALSPPQQPSLGSSPILRTLLPYCFSL